MSYFNQQSSSIANSMNREPSSSAVIATRLIFERRHLPHAYDSPSQTVTVPAPRPMIAIVSEAKIHRDVSTRFGQRLRELRVERNLTQVRMAREFGVDRSYISDLERGRKSISLPTMEVFALGLKLSLAELLTGI